MKTKTAILFGFIRVIFKKSQVLTDS